MDAAAAVGIRTDDMLSCDLVHRRSSDRSRLCVVQRRTAAPAAPETEHSLRVCMWGLPRTPASGRCWSVIDSPLTVVYACIRLGLHCTCTHKRKSNCTLAAGRYNVHRAACRAGLSFPFVFMGESGRDVVVERSGARTRRENRDVYVLSASFIRVTSLIFGGFTESLGDAT